MLASAVRQGNNAQLNGLIVNLAADTLNSSMHAATHHACVRHQSQVAERPVTVPHFAVHEIPE